MTFGHSSDHYIVPLFLYLHLIVTIFFMIGLNLTGLFYTTKAIVFIVNIYPNYIDIFVLSKISKLVERLKNTSSAVLDFLMRSYVDPPLLSK